MHTQVRVAAPRRDVGRQWDCWPTFCDIVAALFLTFACGFHVAAIAQTIEQSFAGGTDAKTSSALVEEFKKERVFWKQMEIGKILVSRRDASVLGPLASWLAHQDRHIRGNVAFLFASFGDPRGLQTLAEILADKSERPAGQGVPIAPSDGRYRFERQVTADRYYAAHLLGDLRDPRGTHLLLPLLNDPDTQSIVPWSLGQIGDKRAIPPLVAALDNDDPSNRVLVIYALQTLDAKEAIPRLTMLLDDHRNSRFGNLVTVSEAAKAAIAKLRGQKPEFVSQHSANR
jgi:HEAT repeat protein